MTLMTKYNIMGGRLIFPLKDTYMPIIWGVALQHNSKIDQQHKPVIIDCIHTAMKGITGNSGTNTAGVALVNHEKIHVIKNSTDSEVNKLLETHVNFSNVITPSIISIIGHTREHPSTVSINKAHPITVDNIVGVSIGNVNNSDALFEKYGFSKETHENNEALFHLLTYKQAIPVQDNIIATAAELTGTPSCVFVTANNPHTIWFFRRAHIIYMRHYNKAGVIIFASNHRLLNIIGTRIEPITGEQNIPIVIASSEGLGLDLYFNKRLNFKLSLD